MPEKNMIPCHPSNAIIDSPTYKKYTNISFFQVCALFSVCILMGIIINMGMKYDKLAKTNTQLQATLTEYQKDRMIACENTCNKQNAIVQNCYIHTVVCSQFIKMDQ